MLVRFRLQLRIISSMSGQIQSTCNAVPISLVCPPRVSLGSGQRFVSSVLPDSLSSHYFLVPWVYHFLSGHTLLSSTVVLTGPDMERTEKRVLAADSCCSRCCHPDCWGHRELRRRIESPHVSPLLCAFGMSSPFPKPAHSGGLGLDWASWRRGVVPSPPRHHHGSGAMSSPVCLPLFPFPRSTVAMLCVLCRWYSCIGRESRGACLFSLIRNWSLWYCLQFLFSN